MTYGQQRKKELKKQARAMLKAFKAGVIDAATVQRVVNYYHSINAKEIWNREARALGVPQFIDEIPF